MPSSRPNTRLFNTYQMRKLPAANASTTRSMVTSVNRVVSLTSLIWLSSSLLARQKALLALLSSRFAISEFSSARALMLKLIRQLRGLCGVDVVTLGFPVSDQPARRRDALVGRPGRSAVQRLRQFLQALIDRVLVARKERPVRLVEARKGSGRQFACPSRAVPPQDQPATLPTWSWLRSTTVRADRGGKLDAHPIVP